MKFPKIIIHNSISVDGSLVNFEQTRGLHHQIATDFKPEGLQ
jgi:hypothetical protein